MTKFLRLPAKTLACLALFGLLASPPASSQDTAIPLATVKAAINATTANWIAFRNFNGKQLLYFTQLLTWKCGLREIRYAINSSHISETWPLPVCNPQNPYHLDPEKAEIYKSFALDSIKFVSVQVVFADDVATEVMTYTPCEGVGEASCAVLLQ